MANAKVVLNNEVLMDITDTTATASDVIEGKVMYMSNGVRTVGTADPHFGLPSGGAANEVLTKVSSSDYDIAWQSVPVQSVNGKMGDVVIDIKDDPQFAALVGFTSTGSSGVTQKDALGTKIMNKINAAKTASQLGFSYDATEDAIHLYLLFALQTSSNKRKFYRIVKYSDQQEPLTLEGGDGITVKEISIPADDQKIQTIRFNIQNPSSRADRKYTSVRLAVVVYDDNDNEIERYYGAQYFYAYDDVTGTVSRTIYSNVERGPSDFIIDIGLKNNTNAAMEKYTAYIASDTLSDGLSPIVATNQPTGFDLVIPDSFFDNAPFGYSIAAILGDFTRIYGPTVYKAEGLTKDSVGLGNVANERQYSAENPPPYPVTSVNGKTGAITLSASDVGALPSDTAIPSNAADVGALPSDTFIPSTASDIGAIPAPASASSDNVLAYNGTSWVPDKRTVILSYGHSTWAEFISAYKSNAVMYCRASSNSNPATGAQGRLAFMAYVDNGDNPTNVEFQYYRSVSSHSYAQQGDQVFIYKLTSAGSWTVTVRETYTKIVPSTGLSSSYSNGVLTLTNAAALPTGGTTGQMLVKTSNTNYAAAWGSVYDIPAGGSTGQVLTKSSDSDYAVTWTSVSQVPAITSADNGKFLRVVDGVWAAQSVNYANGVIF